MKIHVFRSETYKNRCGNSVLTDVNGCKIEFSFTSVTKDLSLYKNYHDIVYLGEFEIAKVEQNERHRPWQIRSNFDSTTRFGPVMDLDPRWPRTAFHIPTVEEIRMSSQTKDNHKK